LHVDSLEHGTKHRQGNRKRKLPHRNHLCFFSFVGEVSVIRVTGHTGAPETIFGHSRPSVSVTPFQEAWRVLLLIRILRDTVHAKQLAQDIEIVLRRARRSAPPSHKIRPKSFFPVAPLKTIQCRLPPSQ
jgi:hypothetical protein